MPLSFSAQRVTTLDVAALTDCFNNSFDDFKNNMPWHYVNRTLEADGVPEEIPELGQFLPSNKR